MYKKHGINFIDEEHYNRFLHLNALAALTAIDKEYSSCLYVLSSSEAIFKKTEACVSKDGIKVSSIIKIRSYSSSEEYMVKIAAALFNKLSTLKLDFYWVVKLDEQQYAVVLEAFRIRRN